MDAEITLSRFRNSDHDLKRVRTRYTPIKSETFFDRIHGKDSKAAANLEAPLDSPRKFARSLFVEDDEDQASDTEPSKPTENLPWDWSVKSRVRILSKTPIVSSTLKSIQEASGLTSFVRCIDIPSTETGLDNSDESKFHQNTMYWQYPHLPWLNLVQRNASSNNQFKMNTPESEMLLKDWMDCFKNLFQLLKASQCAFFYVLGNQFTVLFRAAGIGGIGEMHAFLTPTTRGFRQMLKDEAIEYTQPLKKSSKDNETPNTSLDHQNESKHEDDDEEDELKFLESLGVQTSDIKFKEDIIAKQKEIEDDNGDLSTALIEGVDCQAFFNFLLNAKSTVPKVGRLAGVPPTLLSPVAFLGSSLRRQTSRTSKIRLENEDFYSIELRGSILPNTVHSICRLLSEMKESYSLTMSNYVHTIAFTKASRKVIEDLTTLRETGERVSIGEIKLAECGMSSDIIESMCRLDETAVNIVERFQYNKSNGGFTLF